MPGTFTQIHLHLVFAVKYRRGLIQPLWKDRLYAYITGIVQQNNHKLVIINGMPDHVHLLIGFRPTQTLADLMRDIKQMSTRWINEQHLVPGGFAWQEGYGAFSYSRDDLPMLIRYIEQQEKHHAKRTFLEEYRAMLDAFEVAYEERFLFAEPV